MQTLSGVLDATPEVDAVSEFDHRMAQVDLQLALQHLANMRMIRNGRVDRTGAWVLDPTTSRIFSVAQHLHDRIWS